MRDPLNHVRPTRLHEHPNADTDVCPGCKARLPEVDGPTHRYIGASPACWAIYSSILNAGEPPIAPAPLGPLLVDAYAAQHPGTPSDQSIQSVAVHTLALYGVLARNVAPGNALWVRVRALREKQGVKHGRYQWLTPPSFEGSLTIAAVAAQLSPEACAVSGEAYVREVWARWANAHLQTIAKWYDAYVVPDRL